MTIKKTPVNIRCEICGGTIPAGSNYEARRVPIKNLFNIPAEQAATKIIECCLDHNYKKAEQKIKTEKAIQLDLGAAL